MTSSLDLSLINRALAPTATPEERTALDAYLMAHPEHRERVASLVTITQASARLPYVDVNLPGALRQVDERIARAERGGVPRMTAWRTSHAPSWRWRVPSVAMGAAVVLIGAGVLMHSTLSSSGAHVYATQLGQRETITLSDGTRLTLAPASRVQVPEGYGRSTRDVTLDGEAYFAVVHDVRHPFTVHAGRTITRDIGTAFDVRAYVGDPVVRVAVTEGTVSVGAVGAAREPPAVPSNAPALHAGDMATVMGSQVMVTHDADLATLTAWTTGRLAFHDTPAADVVRDLSRWYDLRIVLADTAMGRQRLTVQWTGAPVDQVITELSALLGAHVERQGHTVVLTTSTGASR